MLDTGFIHRGILTVHLAAIRETKRLCPHTRLLISYKSRSKRTWSVRCVLEACTARKEQTSVTVCSNTTSMQTTPGSDTMAFCGRQTIFKSRDVEADPGRSQALRRRFGQAGIGGRQPTLILTCSRWGSAPCVPAPALFGGCAARRGARPSLLEKNTNNTIIQYTDAFTWSHAVYPV